MGERGPLQSTTLVDTSRGAVPPAQCCLIYVGTPEDGFAGAGRVFSLEGLERVEFRRATLGTLCASIEGGVQRISIPHPWVSGRHAVLVLGEVAALEDEGSRNGTFIEGERIERAALMPGEVFEVGRCFWVMRRLAEVRMTADDPLIPVVNPEFATTMRSVARLAATRVPLLLTGETGTGKSYLARELHQATRRRGPFIPLNMMARSVEPTLFGREDALVERARGGTLFLDDVGALSAAQQSSLLSVLLQAVSTDTDALELSDDDVRVIAASSDALHERASEGTFRPDLYTRLAGYECRMLPLRQRREDLGLAVRSILEGIGARGCRLEVEVFRTMLAQTWPFNVRELRHCLSAAVALSDDDEPISESLWSQVRWPSVGLPAPARLASVRETILREFAEHRGDKIAVAAKLGCELEDVERWINRFNIVPEHFAS